MELLYKVLILLSVVYHPDASVLTSEEVDKILLAENDLSYVLENYISYERQRLNRLEEVARDYRKHSKAALEDPEKSLGNLVSAFITIKRFTVDWEHVAKSYIDTTNSTEYLVRQIRETAEQFPGFQDLENTAKALMRLQDTYDLTPAAMARGQVQGMTNSEMLSPDDCFQVGKIAYAHEDYYHAILWMEHALDEIKQGVKALLNREDLYDHLNYAYYLAKNIKKARMLVLEWLDFNSNAERPKNNLLHYDRILEEEEQTGQCENPDDCSLEHTLKRNRNDWQKSEAFIHYEALCRGEESIQVKDKHKLYCSYKYTHPLFSYAPLREEILHFDPQLMMYHDILTEHEMEKVRALAVPKLHRSAIFRKNAEEGIKYTEHRTSKTSWIEDSEHDVIARVSAKASAVSNLTLETVEQLQVVSYGIGGHYEPHYDFSRDGELSGYDPTIGNRIATVIFYLADVDAGGATVFPEIGARVTPTKGSCAVWYNLHRNGTQDYRTLHAGCPVLTGSKWIGTKWFHEKGQEFVRKCDIDPNI